MKEIHITSQKHGSHIVMVDNDDYDWISKLNLFIYKSKHQKQYYAVHRCPVVKNNVRLHRTIMKASDPNVLIDHIDGNGLNNTKINLRLSTQSTNLMNRGPSASNKYGLKGVSFSKKDKVYSVFITVNGRTIFGGGFKTPQQAAIKYNELARIHHGEFAYQNRV